MVVTVPLCTVVPALCVVVVVGADLCTGAIGLAGAGAGAGAGADLVVCAATTIGISNTAAREHNLRQRDSWIPVGDIETSPGRRAPGGACLATQPGLSAARARNLHSSCRLTLARNRQSWAEDTPLVVVGSINLRVDYLVPAPLRPGTHARSPRSSSAPGAIGNSSTPPPVPSGAACPCPSRRRAPWRDILVAAPEKGRVRAFAHPLEPFLPC